MLRVLSVGWRTLSAALLVWAAKSLALMTADVASNAAYWISVVAWVTLAMLGVSRVARSAEKHGATLSAFAFTLFLGFPFLFDFQAAVGREAPHKAWAFAVLGYCGGVAVFTALRTAALKIASAAGATRVVPRYLVFASADALTLAFAPLLFFSAVPLPIPAARPWFEGAAAAVREAGRIESSLIIFVDPGVDDAGRILASNEARSDPAALAARLAVSVREGLARQGVGEGARWLSVTLVFPETYLNLTGGDFRALAPAFGEAFAQASIEGGIEVLMGARVDTANVILRGFTDPLTGRPRGGVIHAKRTFVPFYEIPVAGVSVRDEDASIALPEDSDEWLATSVTQAGAGLLESPSKQALICYEALFPWRWPRRGDAVVFTNHDLFAAPGTASALYDFTLRQLARATGSSVFLAANKGTSGIYGTPHGQAGATRLSFATVGLRDAL